jgi:hypothetical protein
MNPKVSSVLPGLVQLPGGRERWLQAARARYGCLLGCHLCSDELLRRLSQIATEIKPSAPLGNVAAVEMCIARVGHTACQGPHP